MSSFEQIHLWNEPPSLGLWLVRDFHIKAQVRDTEVAGRERAEKKGTVKEREWGERMKTGRHGDENIFSERVVALVFHFSLWQRSLVCVSERLSPSKRWH